MSTDKEENATKTIDRLKAIRRGNRSVVTKLSKETYAYLSNEDQIEETTMQRLEIIDGQLEMKLEVLEKLNQQILNVCDVGTIEQEIEESEDILGRILDCRKGIEHKLRSKAKPQQTSTSQVLQQSPQPVQTTQVPNPEVPSQLQQSHQNLQQQQPPQQNQSQMTPQQDSDDTIQPTASTSTTFAARTRLPKLTLQKFKGDVSNWTTFWDSFQSAIHNNKDITDIDKFNYLNSLLEGAASRAIKGLTITNDNYKAAVEILKERFGKTQQIISAHMEELMKLQPCQNERPTSLRYIYDKISVHVRGLSSLGVSSDQYGSLLIPIIMSKLSNDIRLQVARKSSKDVWEVNELLQIIQKEVEAREVSECIKLADNTRKNSSFNPSSNSQGNRPTAGSFMVNKQNITIRCAFCGEPHYSASCMKVINSDRRKEILRETNRCFNCLRVGHRLSNCQSDKKCRYCNQRHHQSICNSSKPTQPTNPTTNPEGEKNNPKATKEVNGTTTTTTVKRKSTILLQTARTIATNSDGTRSAKVRILLDSGSQRSYVSNNIKSKLSLKPIKHETLNLNTFGNNKFQKQNCDLVDLYIQDKNHGKIKIRALCFPVICSSLPSRITVAEFPHLEGLELADELEDGDNESIDVLIGTDFYWQIVLGEIQRGDSGPVAVNSKLGWLVSGPIDDSTMPNNVQSHLIISGQASEGSPNNQDDLVGALRSFWETESIGILGQEDQIPSGQEFLKPIRQPDNRYEVSLPWKDENLPIPDNLDLSRNRLRALQFKLQKKPELLKEYDKIIKEQLSSGVIETVPEKEINSIDKKDVHYMPHHAVIQQNRETTKIRVVFDGSAKAQDQQHTLNDCLETGPNYIAQLLDVLLRFRWNPIAFSADIEKAFLMIGIDPQDRDMIRFLWMKNPFEAKPELIHLRFCRLVFGLRPSPSILGAVLNYHLEANQAQDPELVKLMRNSFYVDDFLSGSCGIEEGKEIYKNSRELMMKASFNLRKWNSNSTELLEFIKQDEDSITNITCNSEREDSVTEEDQSYTKSTIGTTFTHNEKLVKVLGVSWNTETDEFLFDFSELIALAKCLPLTKRSFLKVTAKLFDPLGVLSPFTIALKCLFQSMCIEGMNWDEELQQPYRDQWSSFMNELVTLGNARMPRCYFSITSKPVNIQVHSFSDASKKAFAAVVYLRSTYSDGHIETCVVASKTRVAPVKRQTIPRLELLGALISARLVKSISSALPIDDEVEVTFWTDSTTTLQWIRHDKPWKQYVQQRVQEIRQLTSRKGWRHCPGNENPADLPSRGMSAKELINSKVWWEGPEFLKKPKEKWPSDLPTTEFDATSLNEMVKNPPQVTHSFVNTADNSTNQDISKVIDCSKFSSFNRLLRVTAYVLKFVLMLKGEDNDGTASGELVASKVRQAEICWLKAVQAKFFEREINYLAKGETTSQPIYVNQLGLYLDEGLLRSQGRVGNATLSSTSKHPYLLPPDHPLTSLLILHVHSKVKHSGIRDTLTTLRERYWILRGRETVKKVIRRCVLCRKLEGLAYKSQPTPDLPKIRVSDDPPFTHTGVDFAGPLYVTTQTKETKEASIKAYVCLFTCASTRAVHLELTRELSTKWFLQAFRRFVSRRGLPSTLISDNAKTFKAASKQIRAIVRSEEVQSYTTNNQIHWKFIIEKAPWWGGFWERLIQSVKKILRKTVGRSSLNYDELATILTEIECVINSRPITYVYDDSDSNSYPLTPSHLINGRRITNMPSNQFFEIVSTYDSLTRKQRHHRKLLQQFAKQWKAEYLINLRENSRNNSKGKSTMNISVGDVVFVKNDKTPRSFWKIAIVQELLTGQDGYTRAATVKVSSNGKPPKLIRRTLQHLIPIEVKLEKQKDDDDSSQHLDHEQTVNETAVSLHGRPRRKAAIIGELMRKERLNIK